jgi:hypothetical protein
MNTITAAINQRFAAAVSLQERMTQIAKQREA